VTRSDIIDDSAVFRTRVVGERRRRRRR